MKPDEFVAFCRQLHELGRELGVDVCDVTGGIFKASFRQPQQPPPKRDREQKVDEPGQKRTARSPEQARHEFYARVMGDPDDGG